MTNIEFYKKDVEREISNDKSVCLALNEVAHENCWNGKVKHCLDYENCYKCSRDVLDWMTSQLDWSKVKEGTQVLVSMDGKNWLDNYVYICNIKGDPCFDLKDNYERKDYCGSNCGVLHISYWKYAKVKGE